MANEQYRAPQPPTRLLSLRVSRDGGRSWGPVRSITSDEVLAPLATGVWPPCRCPRCRSRGGDG